ncbi:PREDICTED: leukocyte elastase inhibitor isoform X2 [Acromyrmex echinatior]|uniref:leukocyte elastase inhibitor isoform X2 n=1 Tax=Acromyrmex echinatior TaxID=103372 RepID=UPI000580D1AD|nr:PREDICTED: leukocyte elastase inhibitor isoform X2 [Acromyrmex echinatior]
MMRVWLLLGVLALASGQIVYPGQYNIMTPNFGRASALSANYQADSSSQAIQINQQFNPGSAVESKPVNNIIYKGITKFALDLDRAINKALSMTNNSRENVIFSPLSVSVALSLVLLGSAGKTFDEVTRILGLETGIDISQHSEIVHQMFGQLLGILNHRVENSDMPHVNSASGIFVQQGYPIRPEFRAISENVYNSEVINLDFRTKAREAGDIINAWVKKRTMDKIDSILTEPPRPMTNVILLSALYFKGEWNQHFLEGMTRRRPFFIEPNNTVEVDMMYNGGNFPFYEDKSLGVKIVALPYKGLEMSMYVLLPKAEGLDALKNFQNQLTPDTIEYLINSTKNETCVIGFPRMKLSSKLNLNNVLKNLGLHSLFSSKTADLSILSNGYGQAPQAAAIPQVEAMPIPQPFATSIPQGQAVLDPQSYVASIPQGQAAPVPQPFATSIPQASSQMPRQIPSEQSLNTKTDQILIFSRFGNNNSQNAKRNYFAYDDKKRGVSVEQWNSGFSIQKIGRTRRDAENVRRRNNTKSSHATYAVENEDLKKVASMVDDVNTKYVSLKENRHRFENVEKKSRRRRQSRPIDQNFLRFMRTQNFPSYGLDILRNSANLVNPGLYADEVLHKVEMDITEKGTEAAATTAVVLRRDGNQKKLIANRPFMFFIRHDPTKLILFWGTVNKPTPHYVVVR